jgi:hypothetical protein
MAPSFDPVDDGTPVRKLEFVEVGAGPVTPPRTAAASARQVEAEAAPAAEPPVPVGPGEPRWSLWGDAEV